MTLSSRQEEVRDLLVRRQELHIDRAALLKIRDENIAAERAAYDDARELHEDVYNQAVRDIDAELAAIEAQFNATAELESEK